MRFSDIHPKHIYIVDFEPVRSNEFNGKHLAIVLKQNNDKRTFIVIPLTTSPNGEGVNKVKLGIITSLPQSLRGNISYAVFNQIRTVNASRFIALKDNCNIINANVDDRTFFKLLQLATSELAFHLNYDEKIVFFKAQYEQSCIDKSIDSAYNIIKLQKSIEENYQLITSLYETISRDLKHIEYSSTDKPIDAKITAIFENALSGNY